MVEFLQANMLWVAVAVTSGTMLLWPLVSGAGVPGVGPADATLLINREDAIVLDVRETAEWNDGHIAGARHIAMGSLDQHLSELEKFKQRPIIVVCASGNRSSGACGKLKKAGFEKVYNLSGGVSAWAGANLPMTKKG